MTDNTPRPPSDTPAGARDDHTSAGTPPAGTFPPPPPPARGYAPPPAGGYAAPQGAYPPVYAVGAPLSDSDQRLWAVLSHIGGVFVSFLVPLVVWLVFKGRGAFVEDQAKEALNFQITLAIAYLVGAIALVIVVGAFILIAAVICAIVFGIIAAVQSSQGVLYRYPVCIRFIK